MARNNKIDDPNRKEHRPILKRVTGPFKVFIAAWKIVADKWTVITVHLSAILWVWAAYSIGQYKLNETLAIACAALMLILVDFVRKWVYR